MALPYLFEFWAHPHQLPPEGDWRSWVILGGRGAGKTRAGAEWVRTQVEGARPLTKGRAKRVALVAETLDQARDVMIFGDSGILECSPPDRRPKWEATKKRLIWPNGATATIYSAHDPESLRGPQFDAAWVDELAKWRNAQATWDMLQFALRLGDDPRQCVTTTPRNVGVLKSLLNLDSTVTTHATTYDNAAHLADSFLTEVRARYAGTRLGRQDWTAYVLADYTVQGTSPLGWITAAIEAYHDYNADRLVAEVNQGGDLIQELLHGQDATVSYRAVRATRGKQTRAEPIAALYEQGRVNADTWDGIDIPLGEESEQYHVRVLRSGQTVIEFTTSSPKATISNAHITAHQLDIDAQAISIKVAQISNTYGPGVSAVLEVV